jgi:archaeal type IV pilus assembly protein PilA
MPNRCPNCGTPLPYEDAEICPACGSQVPTPVRAQARPKAGPPSSSPARSPAPGKAIRNPILALLLSFLFAGWGQWYNGRRWDGLKFLLATVILSATLLASFFLFGEGSLPAMVLPALVAIAALGVWIYGMYDAYTVAQRINRGEVAFQGKSRLFWLPVVLIVGFFLLSILLSALIAAFVFGMAGGVEKTKTVAATARQAGDAIVVTWQGGMDNDLVESYSVLVTSSTGQTDYKGNLVPDIGEMTRCEGGTSGQDHVVVVASFTDGTRQVVLDTYV